MVLRDAAGTLVQQGEQECGKDSTNIVGKQTGGRDSTSRTRFAPPGVCTSSNICWISTVAFCLRLFREPCGLRKSGEGVVPA